MPQITLPPGEYWVGDPCYVIDNGEWPAFSKSIDRHSGHSQYLGRHSAVFNTAYGDGTYPDGDGRQYPVDTGQIGAIPRALATKNKEKMESLGRLVTSHEPLDCSADEEGRLRFGEIIIYTSHLIIDTGDLSEEEDGCDDKEGRN